MKLRRGTKSREFNMDNEKKKKKPRAGRFSGDLSDVAAKISSSLHFDSRLYHHDIRGSRAHAKMLNRIGILSDQELALIIKGLSGIEEEIKAGSFSFSEAFEDIHMNIEAELTRRIGEAGKKLHTARSRNDQVALDMRLYLKQESGAVHELLVKLVRVIVDSAEKSMDIIMPGYTHLQVAQPVRFSHHLLAYAWGLLRDIGRLRAAAAACGGVPPGSGARAG